MIVVVYAHPYPHYSRAGATLLVSAQAPRTADLLAQRGYAVRAVDVSEFAKAEGAVTCKSLLFEA